MSGRRSHERTINGVFHTVQPIALEHCPVYKENTRKYCIIKTNEFGTILMMEVGAMMVGRITNHEAEPGYVTRKKVLFFQERIFCTEAPGEKKRV